MSTVRLSRTTSATRIVTALSLVLVLAGLGACKTASGPAKGEAVPDFVLPRLDGTVQKLSNHRGSVVLVNMWATWCPPCIEEMPILNGITKQFSPRGLVVLGVAGDDDPEAVRDFLNQRPLDFEVLLDPGGQIGTQYGITGYPETFLVDREGRLIDKIIGPLPTQDGRRSPMLETAIEMALGG